MPMLSSVVSICIHLVWAFFFNWVLKKYEIVADMEFMLVYFVLLALFWKSTVDKLFISLILDPVTVSHELLIEGLKRRKEYVSKAQRKQSSKKANAGTAGSKQSK